MAVDQLLSHYNPTKTLEQHIQEVEQAAQTILQRHSPCVSIALSEALAYAVRFHDVGKAGREYQIYIRAPPKYPARKRALKAHTPLSLFWWLAYAQANHIPAETACLVAATVWKHHGTFPLLTEDLSDGLLTSLCCNEHLEAQLQTFPIKRVNEQLHLTLPPNASLNNTFEDDILQSSEQTKPNLSDAARRRLQAQMVFSILLEADRAFLALTTKNHRHSYLQPHKHPLPEETIVDHFLQHKPQTPLTNLQNQIRKQVQKQSQANAPVTTLSLPTGMGKTMLAAQWALRQYNYQENNYQKIIVVLPFLSVIDQTCKEYRALLQSPPDHEIILEAHSLAPRHHVSAEDAYEHDKHTENNARDFFADTWQSPIVITTFDQFLYAIFSAKNQHLLRLHNLADAIIIMDEIQAIPPRLWAPLHTALQRLTTDFNTRILAMTATQPGFLPQATEIIHDTDAIFNAQQRYALHLNHRTPIKIPDLAAQLIDRLNTELYNERTLVVLNTRTNAAELCQLLEAELKDYPHPIHLISGDIIPKERLEAIACIQQKQPCLVIATQCIEAGVDIDMTHVIRDFAPLDAIIQVAGRCNRRRHRDRSNIEIINIVNQHANAKPSSSFVYDSVLLDITRSTLSAHNVINEEQILPFIQHYFQQIAQNKDTGQQLAKEWSHWQQHIDIRTELRGNAKKLSFVVNATEPDPETNATLEEDIMQVLQIENIWERRRALKALAPRIANQTISIWAKPGFNEADVATPAGPYWLLHPQFYTPKRGFKTQTLTDDQGCLVI